MLCLKQFIGVENWGAEKVGDKGKDSRGPSFTGAQIETLFKPPPYVKWFGPTIKSTELLLGALCSLSKETERRQNAPEFV